MVAETRSEFGGWAAPSWTLVPCRLRVAAGLDRRPALAGGELPGIAACYAFPTTPRP
jgi:hypothetical protein